MPAGLTLAEADELRRDDPDEYIRRARALGRGPLRRDGRLQGRAAPRSSTTATACAPRPSWAASSARSTIPGFVPAYIRPLFCEGKGPFRWVALSGDPADIAATDRAVLEEFPSDERLARWIRHGGRADRVPGAARADLLARLRRARAGSGCASTRWSAAASCRAPIVIGRDHLDSGSVASPYRETEAMLDGSDAIADWPLLNALVNTASGRLLGEHPPRRRRRHRPLDPRRAWCASPTAPSSPPQKLERVLTTDPGTGVMRHVDAGYERARGRGGASAACASRWRSGDA